MPKKINVTRTVVVASQILLLSLAGFIFAVHTPHAQAAGIITVTSQADTTANDGACTLREAITAANTDTASGLAAGECAAGSGADTINFAITGTPDFTNGGQDGYTIAPTTALDNINSQVTIDGYSQPNALANTAASPSPLNGRLLVELNGDNVAGGDGLNFAAGSDNSILKGLIINGFDPGSATNASDSSGVQIKGNYLGTNYSGTVAKPNATAVNSVGSPARGINVQVGGLNPADRNLMSGNTAGSNASAGYPASGWVIQGNYIGVATDGVTALGNAFAGGAGGLSIDIADDVIIGGTTASASNVISGNYSHGLAPDVVNDITIQGNLIGTDYTGTQPVANGGAGIALANNSGTTIGGSSAGAANIISANGGDGIYINTGTNFKVQGNYIGIGSDQGSLPNHQSGVGVAGPATGLIGGSGAGEGNIIANTDVGVYGDGIGVNIIFDEASVAVLGNSIYDNNSRGITFNSGFQDNDANDIDTGPNDYLNYPSNLQYGESGANTDVSFDLDVPAGNYRVEFFANTTPDGSGYGEGEEYLGFQNITSAGTGSQSFTAQVLGLGHANIAATATVIDNSVDGFGPTSQFSAIGTEYETLPDISMSKVLLNPGDIAIGDTANYQLSYTNIGGEDADLSDFGNVGAGPGLIYDFVPTDLINPAGYIADGPFPDSYILDVGNPDLACLYGPAPAASMFALTTDASIGLVVCWLTGVDTTLEPGQSIVANINFTVAPDSDLLYTNYALGSAPQNDPDAAAIQAAFGEPDKLQALIANPTNNFASAAYPPPQQSNGGILPDVLPAVGSALGIGLAAAVLAGFLALRQKRLKKLL